jgi:hypothetical protein
MHPNWVIALEIRKEENKIPPEKDRVVAQVKVSVFAPDREAASSLAMKRALGCAHRDEYAVLVDSFSEGDLLTEDARKAQGAQGPQGALR